MGSISNHVASRRVLIRVHISGSNGAFSSPSTIEWTNNLCGSAVARCRHICICAPLASGLSSRIGPDVGGALHIAMFIRLRAFVANGTHAFYPLAAPRIVLSFTCRFGRPEFFPLLTPEVVLPEAENPVFEAWQGLTFIPYWEVGKVFHFLLRRNAMIFRRPRPVELTLRDVHRFLGPWGVRWWCWFVYVTQD